MIIREDPVEMLGLFLLKVAIIEKAAYARSMDANQPLTSIPPPLYSPAGLQSKLLILRYLDIRERLRWY
jgi:hypothetical protein